MKSMIQPKKETNDVKYPDMLCYDGVPTLLPDVARQKDGSIMFPNIILLVYSSITCAPRQT